MFISKRITSTLIISIIALACTASAFAQSKIGRDGLKQREFCSSDQFTNRDRVTQSEERRFTMPTSGSLSVDAVKNGGISVRSGDANEIEVRACVSAWGDTADQANAIVSSVRINNTGTIRAESGFDSNWSVTYQITVPRYTNLKLTANNGGISVSGVEGDLELETRNGGIALREIAGNVKGKTVNGGVSVSLSGSSWIGNGLDIETTNGGITLSLPETYAATIEASTVNGAVRSNIPELSVTTENIRGGWGPGGRSNQIVTALNGGGAPVKVSTKNGGITISGTKN
jgi:DUF4097 and DUF4098 domain-containing protein YvlB